MSQTASQNVMRLNVKRSEQPQAFERFADDSRRPNLTFVLANGDRESFPYFQKKRSKWHAELGALIVTFIDTRVTIYGRNLMELVGCLEEDDLANVYESHASEFEVADGEAFVERIEFEQM